MSNDNIEVLSQVFGFALREEIEHMKAEYAYLTAHGKTYCDTCEVWYCMPHPVGRCKTEPCKLCTNYNPCRCLKHSCLRCDHCGDAVCSECSQTCHGGQHTICLSCKGKPVTYFCQSCRVEHYFCQKPPGRCDACPATSNRLVCKEGALRILGGWIICNQHSYVKCDTCAVYHPQSEFAQCGSCYSSVCKHTLTMCKICERDCHRQCLDDQICRSCQTKIFTLYQERNAKTPARTRKRKK